MGSEKIFIHASGSNRHQLLSILFLHVAAQPMRDRLTTRHPQILVGPFFGKVAVLFTQQNGHVLVLQTR